MKELLNRVQVKSALYMQLQVWESERTDDFGIGKSNMKKGKDTLTQAIRKRERECGYLDQGETSMLSGRRLVMVMSRGVRSNRAMLQKPIGRWNIVNLYLSGRRNIKVETQAVVHSICNKETVKNQAPC